MFDVCLDTKKWNSFLLKKFQAIHWKSKFATRLSAHLLARLPAFLLAGHFSSIDAWFLFGCHIALLARTNFIGSISNKWNIRLLNQLIQCKRCHYNHLMSSLPLPFAHRLKKKKLFFFLFDHRFEQLVKVLLLLFLMEQNGLHFDKVSANNSDKLYYRKSFPFSWTNVNKKALPISID